MKRLKLGEEFPDDFWNYNINPIVGYYIEPNRNEINDKVVRKYATTPKAI